MNERIIYFAMIIFCIGFISADGLTMIPTSMTIPVTVNQNSNFSMNIFNNYSFDIYNLSFSGLSQYGFDFPNNITIPKNSSQTINFNVDSNSSIHQIINSSVQFNYLVNLPEQVSTYAVSITSNGFNQTFTDIRNGDTIEWINLDTISHTIYSSAFGTMTIEPNSSNSYVFNQIGSYSYYDTNFNIYNQFNGQIEVVNRTQPQLVHDPNYDVPYVFNLQSSLNPTNLTFTNSNYNYSINYGQSQQGLITINNIGTTAAQSVSINSSSSWVMVNPTENNLDLSSGNTEWVTYTIAPFVTSTDQTNQTYNITVSISSFNSPSQNFTVSVFVPYQEISGSFNGSDLATLQYYQNVFCPSNPCSIFCGHYEDPQCNPNGTSSANSGNLTLNVTSSDWNAYLRQQSQQGDSINRITNTLNDLNQSVNSRLETISNQSNESLQQQKSNLSYQQSNNDIFWWIIFGAVSIGCTIFVTLRIRKFNAKKNLIDRPFKKYE